MAKNIYIVEGQNTIAIMRGNPLLDYENERGERVFKTILKYKYGQGKSVSLENIYEKYIEIAKPLLIRNEPSSKWNVTRINFDLCSRIPFNPMGINIAITSRIQNLISERNLYKNLYFKEREKTETRSGKDRMNEEIKKQFKFTGEVKNLLYSPDSGWQGGFRNDWLSPGGINPGGGL